MSAQDQRNKNLIDLLKSKVGSLLKSSSLNLGDAEVLVEKENLNEFFKLLKLDSDLKFDFFVSVTATDWLDSRDHRFELVYHLMSTSYRHRLRIKVNLDEENSGVHSATSHWEGANFMEREVWDMYGIRFIDHPDLRRILMYEEFEGYPLRKDYPLRAKQPRIPLRSPEVRNTAMDMTRPKLVNIGSRKRV
ncbi:MAG: NADH-quinone oxidoreductase subunit C [Bdellovibrionales bacterium]|nr:NADH-quinone oxidoreductase subunit C [Bdellovibrionales bacterium]